jgi:hypothetical protein
MCLSALRHSDSTSTRCPDRVRAVADHGCSYCTHIEAPPTVRHSAQHSTPNFSSLCRPRQVPFQPPSLSRPRRRARITRRYRAATMALFSHNVAMCARHHLPVSSILKVSIAQRMPLLSPALVLPPAFRHRAELELTDASMLPHRTSGRW